VCASVPFVLYTVGESESDHLARRCEVFVGGVQSRVWGVVLVVCVCVSVSGTLFSVGVCVCVCVRDLLIFLYKLVNKRSDTGLGNTQSAPRGGERATVC